MIGLFGNTDPRLLQGGTFLYQGLQFSSIPANLSQFYSAPASDSYHGMCSVEGMPLYQLANLNGHFMPNCLQQQILTAPANTAQYMNPTPSSVPQPPVNTTFSPYQNSGYLYAGANGATVPIPLQVHQHANLYQSNSGGQQSVAVPSHTNQSHLIPSNAMANGTTYYSNGAQPSQPASISNSLPGSMHSLRYSLPPNQQANSTHNPVVSLYLPTINFVLIVFLYQRLSMNGTTGQYYQYQHAPTSNMESHGSMHMVNGLAPGSSMHSHNSHSHHLASLHSMSSGMQPNTAAMTNMSAANVAPLGNAQLNASTLMHHPQQYPTYPTMSAHQLTAENSQLAAMAAACVHLKSDGNAPLDMMDNSAMNAQHHLGANNGYGMAPIMEVVWPQHMQGGPAPAYANANPTHVAGNTYPTGKQYPSSYANVRTNSNCVSSTSSAASCVNYNKSSHNPNCVPLTNNHITNSSANPASGVSSKESQYSAPSKVNNSRHANTSNYSTNKKSHNGTVNGVASSGYAKSKMVNGSSSGRYSNETCDQPSHADHATTNSSKSSSSAASCNSSYSSKPCQHSALANSVPNGAANTSSARSSQMVNGTAVAASSVNPQTVQAQTYVTKTVNGVQIYALANGEQNGEHNASMVAYKA